ncbi:hypothetical protein PIROE2DRAFT_19307 [Piromyces sp. E2]|nr:hypothetical protein PIROE2DRAFT_19307 [Piromyces sp. E2]|eukprot:OUM56194.1 hypothetical protein PIROE2DRAFT_19307 [Piromyces sp. E2]
MSNSLAHYLRKQGIGRNDIIPIICERSYHFVVGVLGIMKSGAAYLPIDPEFPKDRIQCMIEESKSHLILYYINNKENKEKLTFNNIEIYSLHCHNYEKDTHEISNINQSSDLIYVLFTSGTTGKPKGTLITHNNIINYCLYSQKQMYGSEFKSILAYSKFTFDMSISEINYALLNIKIIVLCNDEEFNNPELLGNIIMKYNIDFIVSTPSRFKNYLNVNSFKKSIKNLKYLSFGGENLNIKFLKYLIKYTDAEINNGYGPTETTACCTISKIKRKDIFENKLITIGNPLCNYKLYILDEYLNPVPVGVKGEIYISGLSVGKGYLNREDLTNEMFLNCPFSSNNKMSKMYKTGDIGKWTTNGNIVYLGRKDNQIKIRGQRIEISEIENVIKKNNNIAEAVVIIYDDDNDKEEQKSLVCYYIENSNFSSKSDNNISFKNYLKSKLPIYMIPKYFIKINEIPITTNGKLNKKALPKPNINNILKENYEEPKTQIEKEICSIFSDTLNISKNTIGRYSSFIDIGGDSFSSFNVISKIENKFKLKLNIKDILSKPTVYELSEYVAKLLNDENGKMKIDIIEKRGNKEFPVTSQQLGVYIDSIKNPNSVMYNVPVFYKMDKNVNIQKIKDAIIQIFNKQEILKSKYYSKVINGKTNIYGYIDDNNCKLNFEYYNYENVNSFIRPFDLSNGPLIRVGFLKNRIFIN